jgi:hypothetical protein
MLNLSTGRPGRFTYGEKAPDTQGIGGWLGPVAGLEAAVNRNIFAHAGNRTTFRQPFSS